MRFLSTRHAMYTTATVALLLTAALPIVDGTPCRQRAGCEFWDGNYHEYILNDWDTAKLDVIIVPPASPFAARDIATLEESVQAWEDGIMAMGASWLTDAFEINHYTLGLDVIPPQALADPEIIVFSAQFNPVLLLGIGLANPFSVCADWLTTFSGAHQHEESQWLVGSLSCENLGNQCYVVNTSFLTGNERRMFDLNSHELGHCLGIGHVGDAGDFDAKTFPAADIMSYQHNPAKVHCVSTLNMKGIHGVFAQTLGRPSPEWLRGGQYVHMAPSAYAQTTCLNPPTGPLPAVPSLPNWI